MLSCRVAFHECLEAYTILPSRDALAHLHTSLPDRTGERNLVLQLKALADQQLHIWCGLSFIPGVRDCDLLLWHEKAGVFLVEIKAVPILMIERFGWEHSKIKDRREDKGPVNQSWQARFSLVNYLSGRNLNPWIVSSAAWPQVSRDQWNANWDDRRVCGSYAESMLFYEDFYSTPETLLERLMHIRHHPPQGVAPSRSFVNKPRDLEALKVALHVEARPVPTPGDLDRLTIIEQRVRKEERERVPPMSAQHWFYHGKPGTGKTFRLLRIGFWHATQGCNVLYLCFNKVLGADVQRTLNFSEKLPLAEGTLDARDAFDVLRRFLKSHVESQDHDDWARTVVALMAEQKADLKKYDTILIDEAQDLPSWAFDMAFLHAAENATILIASGKGQEMYGIESEALSIFRMTSKSLRCNRNFRNTEQISRFAMIFNDADCNASKIPAAAKALQTQTADNQTLVFERPGGSLPALICLDDTEIDAIPEGSSGYSDLLNAARSQQYKGIIEAEMQRLRDGERPMDLLILVPSENSFERAWVTGALDSMRVGYLDYTDDNKRRCPPQDDLVRLCTFHSSRGIEGQRVLIFGLERIDDLASRINVSATKLGYIVLSRASLDLAIVYRPRLKSQTMRFIESAIEYLRPRPSK